MMERTGGWHIRGATTRQLAGMLRPVIVGIRAVCDATLTFAYPDVCALCHADLSQDDGCRSQSAFCPSCRQALLPPEAGLCLRCGASIGPYLNAMDGCSNCRRRRLPFRSVIRLGLYQDRLRQACIRCKEGGSEYLAASLGELLYQREGERLRQCHADVVVPVPHHWLKRLFHAHNPPETLGGVLSRRLKADFDASILRKSRRTPDQSSLSSEQRRANLRNAFRVRGTADLSGASVLLVDDILTTGTTANEASKTLRRAGAKQVTVAVVAVVPKPG